MPTDSPLTNEKKDKTSAAGAILKAASIGTLLGTEGYVGYQEWQTMKGPLKSARDAYKAYAEVVGAISDTGVVDYAKLRSMGPAGQRVARAIENRELFRAAVEAISNRPKKTVRPPDGVRGRSMFNILGIQNEFMSAEDLAHSSLLGFDKPVLVSGGSLPSAIGQIAGDLGPDITPGTRDLVRDLVDEMRTTFKANAPIGVEIKGMKYQTNSRFRIEGSGRQAGTITFDLSVPGMSKNLEVVLPEIVPMENVEKMLGERAAQLQGLQQPGWFIRRGRAYVAPHFLPVQARIDSKLATKIELSRLEKLVTQSLYERIIGQIGPVLQKHKEHYSAQRAIDDVISKAMSEATYSELITMNPSLSGKGLRSDLLNALKVVFPPEILEELSRAEGYPDAQVKLLKEILPKFLQEHPDILYKYGGSEEILSKLGGYLFDIPNEIAPWGGGLLPGKAIKHLPITKFPVGMKEFGTFEGEVFSVQGKPGSDFGLQVFGQRTGIVELPNIYKDVDVIPRSVAELMESGEPVTWSGGSFASERKAEFDKTYMSKGHGISTEPYFKVEGKRYSLADIAEQTAGLDPKSKRAFFEAHQLMLHDGAPIYVDPVTGETSRWGKGTSRLLDVGPGPSEGGRDVEWVIQGQREANVAEVGHQVVDVHGKQRAPRMVVEDDVFRTLLEERGLTGKGITRLTSAKYDKTLVQDLLDIALGKKVINEEVAQMLIRKRDSIGMLVGALSARMDDMRGENSARWEAAAQKLREVNWLVTRKGGVTRIKAPRTDFNQGEIRSLVQSMQQVWTNEELGQVLQRPTIANMAYTFTQTATPSQGMKLTRGAFSNLMRMEDSELRGAIMGNILRPENFQEGSMDPILKMLAPFNPKGYAPTGEVLSPDDFLKHFGELESGDIGKDITNTYFDPAHKFWKDRQGGVTMKLPGDRGHIYLPNPNDIAQLKTHEVIAGEHYMGTDINKSLAALLRRDTLLGEKSIGPRLADYRKALMREASKEGQMAEFTTMRIKKGFSTQVLPGFDVLPGQVVIPEELAERYGFLTDEVRKALKEAKAPVAGGHALIERQPNIQPYGHSSQLAEIMIAPRGVGPTIQDMVQTSPLTWIKAKGDFDFDRMGLIKLSEEDAKIYANRMSEMRKSYMPLHRFMTGGKPTSQAEEAMFTKARGAVENMQVMDVVNWMKGTKDPGSYGDIIRRISGLEKMQQASGLDTGRAVQQAFEQMQLMLGAKKLQIGPTDIMMQAILRGSERRGADPAMLRKLTNLTGLTQELDIAMKQSSGVFAEHFRDFMRRNVNLERPGELRAGAAEALSSGAFIPEAEGEMKGLFQKYMGNVGTRGEQLEVAEEMLRGYGAHKSSKMNQMFDLSARAMENTPGAEIFKTLAPLYEAAEGKAPSNLISSDFLAVANLMKTVPGKEETVVAGIINALNADLKRAALYEKMPPKALPFIAFAEELMAKTNLKRMGKLTLAGIGVSAALMIGGKVLSPPRELRMEPPPMGPRMPEMIDDIPEAGSEPVGSPSLPPPDFRRTAPVSTQGKRIRVRASSTGTSPQAIRESLGNRFDNVSVQVLDDTQEMNPIMLARQYKKAAPYFGGSNG